MRNICGIMALLAAGATSVVWAQQGAPRENLNAKGTVKGVRPGLLAVVTEQGEQILVKTPDRPQNISFVASANRNWLRPRMLVKFKNRFDAKGNPAALVRQLEVISLRADTQIGLTPDAKLASGAAGLFSDDEPTKKRSATETMSFTVVGTLRGMKDGKMLVQSQLDPNASISVDVADYSLAREGDTVQVSGWYYLGRRDQVFSTQLSISSKQKLGMDEEAAKKASKKKPTPKKDTEKTLEELFAS